MKKSSQSKTIINLESTKAAAEQGVVRELVSALVVALG